MTYILKSWFDEKVVYKSDDLFSSDKDLWNDVSVMKQRFHGTYAIVVKEI